MKRIDGLLIDLDGTIWEGDALVPGAAEAVGRLRRREMPHLFTTNTSRMSRRDVVGRLERLGLTVEPERVLTAPLAAARWLRREGLSRVMLLLPESTHEDFGELRLTGTAAEGDANGASGAPDAAQRTAEADAGGPAAEVEAGGPAAAEVEAVVVGDLGAGFTFERLDAAFRALRGGARLVAVHKNRWWLTDEGPTLDAGPFVVGLEYAAEVEAVLVGKPAPAFFELAADLLGLRAERLAVVGDDPESDVRGARAAGLTAVQVETGKFDAGRARGAPPGERPHHRIASVAELPALLEEGLA